MQQVPGERAGIFKIKAVSVIPGAPHLLVGEAVLALKHKDARVTAVDTVTGPYDVIVQMEADDLDKLGSAITEGLQRIQGVQRTTTCLAVKLG